MYITLNRADEWERAVIHGLKVDGHILCGLENDELIANSASITTGCIDSYEHDHIWDAIIFDWSFAPNTSCRVSCFTSNSDEKTFIQEEEVFLPIKIQSGSGLLGCRGRYLWLRIEILTQDRTAFMLKSIKLRLPGERIIDYLPEIYRRGVDENDFFPRFMAIFDSIFFELENDIDHIGEKLDYRTAGEDMLSNLAAWLGINGRAVSAETLRAQIGSAVQEYRTSGTREGLIGAVKRQTGHTPVIVEYFQVEKMARQGRDRQTYTKLFGTNPYRIHIMLPEVAVNGKARIDALASKIRSCVPAYVEFEIIPLHMNFMLDRHTYLEINSYISDFSGLVIEEKSALYHDVYIGE